MNKIKITDEMYKAYLVALYNSGWGSGIKAIAPLIAAQVLEIAAQVADSRAGRATQMLKTGACNQSVMRLIIDENEGLAAEIRALKFEVE